MIQDTIFVPVPGQQITQETVFANVSVHGKTRITEVPVPGTRPVVRVLGEVSATARVPRRHGWFHLRWCIQIISVST